ncbi:hypothetical protein C1Y40_05433 [Mycobacterium talmoniae]|uniref:Uncharacterized protein n=1 Tax=Mycobacterium talmoniae TaxID=1858794 RepID=A0A2S8BCL5_9MYCO|nr:hypothetical protein C1Y40_05433 [Mycobacterium talmoniae]
MIPASDGKLCAAWAFTSASSTSERSAGTITTCPSTSRSKMCSGVMPPTITLMASRRSSSGSPLYSVPPSAWHSSAMVGAASSGTSGTLNAGNPRPASVAVTVSSCAGSHRLAITAAGRACAAASSARQRSVIAVMVSRSRSWPLMASSSGAPRFTAMRALKLSSVGLTTSV